LPHEKGVGVDEWEWLDALTLALDEPGVDRAEIGSLLRLARDVAHGLDRKLAPLSTFVAGLHVGRRMAEGASREEAMEEVMGTVSGLLPEAG
jgi:uncharacterized protein DUF6457